MQISPLWRPISPTSTVGSSCNLVVICTWMLGILGSNFRIIQPFKPQLFRSKCTQLISVFFFILFFSFIPNAPLTPILSFISPHYICCFLPTTLVLDFFYLNKRLIATPPSHLPFLYLPLKFHFSSLSFFISFIVFFFLSILL